MCQNSFFFFLWLNNILLTVYVLCGAMPLSHVQLFAAPWTVSYTMFYLSVHLLMDIWVVFTFWQLWIVLPWTKSLLLMLSPNSEVGLHRAAILQLWQLMRWACSCYYIIQNTPNIAGEERKAWRHYAALSINLSAEKQIPLWLTWFFLESVAEVGNTVTVLFLLFHN